MAKGDVLVRMKADVSNYDANIAKARRTLDGFKQDNLTLGGILNQSTKSIVAAAAQYASFAAIIGTVASGMSEAISQGSAMAKEMEGVSMAFERLNQPGLLDNLREATHGTVNDLELMKQAVKFDNFNLSIEQMGTFLAFAQQQAKDTGQDVNYLVDSIVTGLGRKSLPILDNLGLSAEAIRDKMKETGDMTTAVAEIIQERMEAAGGYVETAADRAAQAQVRLDNAMTELGNTMNSLTGSGATLWTELKIGAVELANTAIKPLISLFNQLASYVQGTSVEDILTRGMTDVTDTVDDNGRLIRKNAINSIPEITVSGTAPKRKSSGGSRTDPSESIMNNFQKSMAKAGLGADSLKGSDDRYFISPQALFGESDDWEKYKDTITGSIGGIGEKMDNLKEWTKDFDPFADKMKEIAAAANQQKAAFGLAAQAAGSLGTALSSMEDPAAKAAGTVIQAIADIALGFAMASTQASALGPFGWIAWLAAGAAAMATTIATVHSLTGYSEGGIVGGSSFSGDNVFAGNAMVNSGELILNRAQQNSLAASLSENSALANLNLTATLKGEDLRMSINRNGRRTGKGEMTTTKFR